MSAARARKILIAAFAISLLIHLLLAGYIRWPFNQPSNETEIVKVRRLTVARVVPHTPVPTAPPTPPPTPVPTPAPTLAAAAVKSKVIPPSVTPRGTKGARAGHAVVPVTVATSAPARTPIPMPTATPLAAQPCSQHDISPAVAATSPPVDIPPEARASKVSGTAAIQVQIDPQGHATDATVSQSSGSTALDGVALQMAKSATYTPELVKCKPVASAYTFTVKFVAW